MDHGIRACECTWAHALTLSFIQTKINSCSFDSDLVFQFGVATAFDKDVDVKQVCSGHVWWEDEDKVWMTSIYSRK